MTRFAPPSADEHFYARALAIMAGPTRRVALLMRVVNLAYWMAILGALAWLLAQVVDRAAPITIHSVTLLNPTIAAGDPLRVRTSFTRHRTCEVDITYMVFDGAQEVTRFGPIHSSAGGAPGDETLVRAWPSPLGMAPGQGRLRIIDAFSCPGNYLQAIYPVILVQPDIPFTILGERAPAEPRG